MNRIFYSICLIAVIFGFAFYLVQNHSIVSDASTSIKHSGNSIQNLTTRTTVGQESTVKSKKKCACCRKTLAQVRDFVEKNSAELEAWGIKTINTYGYEEGMKRVTAKSAMLAERIQRIFEKEKPSTTPAPSQVSQ